MTTKHEQCSTTMERLHAEMRTLEKFHATLHPDDIAQSIRRERAIARDLQAQLDARRA